MAVPTPPLRPVPGPPLRPAPPAGAGPEPAHVPSAATPSVATPSAATASVEDPRLDEVRERLAALDEVELSRHPEAFTAVDGLLRAALEGTDPGRS